MSAPRDQSLCSSCHQRKPSERVPCQALFPPGARVTVAEGVFAGMEGVVLGPRGLTGRVRIQLTIFGRPVPLEIEAFEIKAVALTEDEWWDCGSVERLATCLRSGPRQPSPRKARLFACACARRFLPLLVDGRDRQAVELAEAFADEAGSTTRQALTALWEDVWRHSREGLTRATALALEVVAVATDPRPCPGQVDRAIRAAQACSEVGPLAPLVREVFGNPFRVLSVEPAWLAWNDGCVPKLARSLSDERRWQDLPILGDALEDAGCDNADLLDHCRQRGEHVRGCWALDAVLLWT
jgi:hypothetical protein